MAYERLGLRPLDYRPVRHRGVRVSFRGPARDLQRGYVSCLGGTETYGPFVERPWPALLEAEGGPACLNRGVPNAGPDPWLAPGGPLPLAQGARAVVLQIPCGINLSNPFHAVHPRRNDRLLRAALPLERLYPEVDFTGFHFTRHMMRHLHARSPRRFAQVRARWWSRSSPAPPARRKPAGCASSGCKGGAPPPCRGPSPIVRWPRPCARALAAALCRVRAFRPVPAPP
jgi:hypothetical protein